MQTENISPLHRDKLTTRCSIGDHLVRWATPRVAFCYRARIDPERLASALARVLTDYQLYAGRIAYRDGWMHIERGCGTVPLELDVSKESFDALVTKANQTRGANITPTLPLARTLRGKGPLFAARLTHTADGSVLGFTFQRSTGDLASALMLVTAWAHAHRDLSYTKPIDLADRDEYLAEHVPDLPEAQSALRMPSVRECLTWLRAFLRGHERVVLRFSHEEVLAMQAAIGGDHSVTADDAVWACLTHLVHQLRGQREPARLALTMNLRKRFCMPQNVLGNMVGLVDHTVDPGQSPREIAIGLRKAIKRPAGLHFAYHATQRFVEAHPRRWQRCFFMPVLHDLDRGNLLISSITRFPYDEVMFVPNVPATRMFASLSDNPGFAGLGLDYPSPQDPGRELVLWLPRKLSRLLSTAEARASMLAGVRA